MHGWPFFVDCLGWGGGDPCPGVGGGVGVGMGESVQWGTAWYRMAEPRKVSRTCTRGREGAYNMKSQSQTG